VVAAVEQPVSVEVLATAWLLVVVEVRATVEPLVVVEVTAATV
jgi:hypothetical protein